MSHGSVEDRLAIRELIENFTVGVMHGNADLWMSCWAEGGSWSLPSLPEPVKGKDNLRTTFSSKTGYFKFMSMLQFPHGTVFNGNTAKGRAYGQEIIIKNDNGIKMAVGFFDDEYVKQDGRWYFQSRVFNVVGLLP
jgi:hypothetical protein